MKTGTSLKCRQGGAVAIMVGFSMVILVGFLAMVIDLGHLYLTKTELQNAADAAALAGAKELNSSAAGVTNAINKAVDIAHRNSYDFSKPVATTAANLDIWVCSSPNNCTVLASTAAADTTNVTAADKTFLKVHTRNRNIAAWFAPIWNILNVSTYGMAVAGRYVANITPLGVCAVDELHKTLSDAVTGELIEFGFRRGLSYNIPDLNPLAGLSQDPFWINPIDVPPSCHPSNSSTSFNNPFVCAGKAAVITTLPTTVWINTGVSASLEKALNSRFDDFTGSPCDPVTAPPDTNVREYRCTDTSNPENCDNNRMPTQSYADINLPKDWMAPSNSTTPTRHAILIDTVTKKPKISPDFNAEYGVLWTYNRAVHAVPIPGTSDYKAGSPFNADNTDWGLLYNGGTINTDPTTGYPSSVAPYNQTSGKYFLGPPTHTGTPNRRVLNVAIIACEAGAVGGGGPCGTQLSVIGIGKFFLTRGANLSGSGNSRIVGEFAGSFSQLPPSDIKLYQ